MKFLWLLFLPAAMLLAQPAPAKLDGVVLNSATNQPVRKALVILRAQNTTTGMSYTSESDGNGIFVIEDVEPGAYVLSADRTGFVFETPGAAGAPPPRMTIESGQQVKDVKLRLTPLGVITGKILDDDGDPVRGATVEAMQYSYAAGKKHLNGIMRVIATDKGDFRLYGLRAGTFYIRAEASGLNRSRFGNTDLKLRGPRPPAEYVATYFPSATDVSRAVPIELAAGALVRGMDLRLRREMLHTVRVKLPQSGSYDLQIAPFDPNATVGSTNFKRRLGDMYEFPYLLPGSYVVMGTRTDGDKRSFARQPVEVVDADVEGIALTFSPGADVSGMVRVEGTAPRPVQSLRINLQRDGPTGFGVPDAAVNPDGSFVLHDVVPFVYEVGLATMPGMYRKSVRLGDHELPDGRIDLTRGGGPLVIVLGTDVGVLEGSVQDAKGEPAARVRVTVIPYGSHLGRSDLQRYMFTTDKGTFRINTVPPGEYKVFAWEDVEVGAPQDPEFRKPFEKHGVVVTMEPGGHATVELKAVPAAATRQ